MRRWIRGFRVVLILVVVSAVVVPLVVGDRALRTSAAAPDEPFMEILTNEPLPLTDLLRAVGLLTEIPLRWDPDAHRLTTTRLVMPQNLVAPREALFDAVRALLASRGFALSAVGEDEAAAWEVIDLEEASRRATFRAREVEPTDESLSRLDGEGGQYVTTTLRLERAVADERFRAELVPLLSSPGIGTIALAPGGTGLVVSDFAPYVARIVRTARRMDALAPTGIPKEPYFELRLLEHESVEQVLPVLREALGGVAPTVSPRSLTAVPRLNGILIYGTPLQLDQTKKLIDHLDVPIDSLAPHTVETVELHALDARRTAAAFTQLIEGSPDGWRSAPGGPVPVIVAHEETNSVLVSGPREGVDRLADLIREREARAKAE